MSAESAHNPALAPIEVDLHAVPPDAVAAQKQAMKNLLVGFLLAVGTLANVALAYAPLGSVTAHVLVALAIAGVEVALVAAISMHLMEEKASIVRDLVLAGFFVLALLGLSLLAFTDHIRI